MRKLLITGFILFIVTNVFAQLVDNVVLQSPVTSNSTVLAKQTITLKPGFHVPYGINFTAQIDYYGVTENNFDHNFVKTESALIAGVTETSIDGLNENQKNTSYQYIDGLGRAIQMVAVKASPTKNDIVQHMEYDELGRQVREYLPYSVASQNGAFRGEAKGEQGYFYANQTNIANSAYPYSEKVFDNSPLNRLMEQGAPGADWQPDNLSIANSGHTVKMNYLTNTTTDNVIIWSVDNSGNCINEGIYDAGKLFKNEIIDENDIVSENYTDKSGQVVLKVADPTGLNLKTYYAYDDFGRLRYVFPPKSISLLSATLAPTSLSELIYYYEYDEKGRMVKKKIPGAEPINMVYDKRDRLVLSQNGNLRTENKWNFTKYDILNRPVMSGVIQLPITTTYDQLVTAFNSHTIHFESTNTSQTYKYSLNNSYPGIAAITENDLLTISYYDNYNSLNSYGYSYSLPGGFEAVNRELKPINQLTGTIVWNLDKSDYYVTVNYYDKYNRLIQSISENHLNGIDRLTTQYDFSGKVTQTKLSHTLAAIIDPVEKTIWEFYEYDHTGRLMKYYHQYGNNTAHKILMTAYTYNENGKQIAKKMHSKDGGGNFLQEVNYAYNTRGWLTKINDANLSNGKDLFGMELEYNNFTTNFDPLVENLYDGNISAMYWNTKGSFMQKRGYGFNYDAINRLKNAFYGDAGGWQNGLYDVQGISYDINGNILSISRNAGATNGEIDNLGYIYDGNKLIAVSDNAIGTTGLGFIDGTLGNASIEYEYDANGNMVIDKNKHLSFNYNVLNLPESVYDYNMALNSYMEFNYDASGNKLSSALHTRHSVDKFNVAQKHYLGNFIYNYIHNYNTGVLKTYELAYVLTPEGRITIDASGKAQYEYFLKDHLGNVRASFADFDANGIAELIQEDNYYPFGMKIPGNGGIYGATNNNYLYNSKELHEEMGLKWYDYGLRMYDPALGRFPSIDPIADQFAHVSPFNYAENTPIVAIDLWGLQAFYFHGLYSSSADWQTEGFQKVAAALLMFTNNTTTNMNFDWSEKARGLNVTSQRTNAAFDAAMYVLNNNVAGEDITLIGVSHGGNVAIQTAKILNDIGGYKCNIITLNTPTESSTGGGFFDISNSWENPTINKGINDMIQFQTEGDWLAKYLGTELTNYDSDKMKERGFERFLLNSDNTRWNGDVHATGLTNIFEILQYYPSNLNPIPFDFQIPFDTWNYNYEFNLWDQ